MTKKNIKITGIYEVTQLASLAAKVDGDVTLYRGRYVVDGKSLMGVMTLDISQGVMIEYPENAKEFEQFLEQFEVK